MTGVTRSSTGRQRRSRIDERPLVHALDQLAPVCPVPHRVLANCSHWKHPIAKVFDDPTVATFGHLCAGFLAMGALFWLVLGLTATFPNMVAPIRKSESV